MMDDNGVVYVGVRLQEDKVIVLKVNTRGSGKASGIYGAEQLDVGRWVRQPTLAVLQHEVDEAIPPILADESRGYKGPIVGWKILPDGMPQLERGWAFRPSWRWDGKDFSHHMPEAREGYRRALRRFRQKPLADLDVEFMRALEAGQATDRISAAKQKLRDVTADPRIDAAQTVDELKAIALPE
jgi:hypothetical protein